MRRLLLWGLIALLGVAVYFFAEPLRLSALAAVGRTNGCPYDKALASAEHERELTRVKDRIVAGSRLVRKDRNYHLWDTPHGSYWITEGSDYMLHYNLAEQECNIYGSGERAVKPGDIVLDCGANVGVFTREALAHGARLVVAIEIAPENIECLRRNLDQEVKSGRVIIYPKGVWDKDDVLTLKVAPGNSPADSVVIQQPGAQAGPQVPLTTIDKIVDELKLERVDFIKMDIEGAERNALAGARQALARFHPRLSLASYHRPDDPEALPKAAREGWPGYRMEYGPCADVKTYIRPDVLYFY
jgi:FkbM family methyltransferase